MNREEEMRSLQEELKSAKVRVEELEQRVEHLRVSRRVLMTLLEKVEREKISQVYRLEKENLRLQRDNTRFAKWILMKNRQIVELMEKDREDRESVN